MVFRTHHNAAVPKICGKRLHLFAQFAQPRALGQAEAVPFAFAPVAFPPHIHRHRTGRCGRCRRA
ncbi:hypothetical protein SDC9_106445 [bioreactor metagenome]|uniref:Uncharacterized protein n=1 Tax=bioreactor metagenome TaxID=1076179 RepID=A0A645B2C4_9ZZZZ